MPFYAVCYTYTDDTSGRDALRPSHKQYLSEVAKRGLVLGSGPFAPGEEAGALMIYRAPHKDVVREAVMGDPFWIAGHVAEYTVTQWVPMIGPWAVDAQRLAGMAS